MGSGRVPAAGAVLVALLALGARPAAGTRPSAFFQWTFKAECHYLNGTERVRYLVRYVYNRQEYAHFDSDVGKHVADTALGEPQAEYWNSNAEILENRMNEVDTYCRHNYGVVESFTVQRSVEPKVRVSALQSGSLPETDRLACYVTGFYPPEIEVKWFLNGREETERVVSTDVMQNGDWTYQVLVVLETVPRRGDSYVCRVEHASLRQPISQAWGKAPGPCPAAGGAGARPPALSRRLRPRRAAGGRGQEQAADGRGGLRAGARLPGAGALRVPARSERAPRRRRSRDAELAAAPPSRCTRTPRSPGRRLGSPSGSTPPRAAPLPPHRPLCTLPKKSLRRRRVVCTSSGTVCCAAAGEGSGRSVLFYSLQYKKVVWVL